MDKGSCTALWDHYDYIAEAEKQLSAKMTMRKLT